MSIEFVGGVNSIQSELRVTSQGFMIMKQNAPESPNNLGFPGRLSFGYVSMLFVR